MNIWHIFLNNYCVPDTVLDARVNKTESLYLELIPSGEEYQYH